MTAQPASTLRRYAVATAAVTAAFGLALPFHDELPYLVYPVLLALVAGCAFYGGMRTGLVATAVSFSLIACFFADSTRWALLSDPTVLAFAVSSLVLSVLLGARGHIEAERDELAAAVALERERLEAVLDSSHIGVGFLDSKLRFLQANEALAAMNGLPVREHLGRTVIDVAPWTPEQVLDMMRGALAGEAAIGLEVNVEDPHFGDQDGHFIVSFLPLRGSSGDVVGVGFTVNDVSLLKQNEVEQTRLRALAEQAQIAADTANQMKDEFLMTLSHEMRSPLQGILGWGRLLRGGQLDVKQADRAFETIERIVRQQAELLNGLFDVSRIVAGKMEIEHDPLDLSGLVRQAFEDKQFAARKHGITMTCDTPSVVRVVGDPERIHQILANLLTNAIKFTPNGGRVELRCVERDGEAAITVRDTGEGIPPAFIQHVFERFSQADRSRGRRHRGLGIGLSIVYHLVDLHGGRVVANSPGPGGGTTMTVYLPLEVAAPERAALRSQAAVGPLAAMASRQRLPGVRVLIVEDDINVRESTAAFLAMRAALVTTAASASAGVATFVDVKPDVVVSDLGLPDEDGYAFLRQIRALDAGRDVPVIAFSGYSSAREHARCLAAGFAAHLIKPVDPEALVRALAAVIVQQPSSA